MLETLETNSLNMHQIKMDGFNRFEDYLKAQQKDSIYWEMLEMIKRFGINSFDDLNFYYKKYNNKETAKTLVFHAMRILGFEIVDALIASGEQNRNVMFELIDSQIKELGFEEVISPKQESKDDLQQKDLSLNLKEEINDYIDQCIGGMGVNKITDNAGGDVVKLFAN